MDKIELRSNLHDFVDQLENVELLKKYYSELKKLVAGSRSNIWDRLSDQQKQDLLDSFEDSESNSNLVDNDEAIEKLKRYL